MQKIKLIISTLSRLFLIFLLVFIWVKFFVRKLGVSVLVSVAITLLIDMVIKIFSTKKTNREMLKIKEKENCENMFFSIAISKNYLTFFENLAKKKYKAQKNKKYVIIQHDDGNVILYPLLSFSPLSAEEIKKIILELNKLEYRKIVIPCGEINKDCYDFISRFNKEIILLDKYETCSKLYKEYDFYPEIIKNEKINKKATFKEILDFSFNKYKVKSYLLSALALLFSSIFVRNNLYYCIVASILVIFAILSFFNPFRRGSKVINTLE